MHGFFVNGNFWFIFTTAATTTMKGRNPRLIARRNEYLIKRYYFWYELRRLRPDDAIARISEHEVFLEEEYIYRLIRDNSSLLTEIKKRKPSERQLDSFVFSCNAPVVQLSLLN